MVESLKNITFTFLLTLSLSNAYLKRECGLRSTLQISPSFHICVVLQIEEDKRKTEETKVVE